jgi:hypothetical protein
LKILKIIPHGRERQETQKRRASLLRGCKADMINAVAGNGRYFSPMDTDARGLTG